jgi:hypothetical protein
MALKNLFFFLHVGHMIRLLGTLLGHWTASAGIVEKDVIKERGRKRVGVGCLPNRAMIPYTSTIAKIVKLTRIVFFSCLIAFLLHGLMIDRKGSRRRKKSMLLLLFSLDLQNHPVRLSFFFSSSSKQSMHLFTCAVAWMVTGRTALCGTLLIK